MHNSESITPSAEAAPDGDVFGDAVNVAARVCDLAKGRQILTTDATVSLLDSNGEQATRFLQRIELRGRPGAIGLCEAVLDSADLTAIGDAGATTAGDRLALTTLLLSRGTQRRMLMRGSSMIMIGRGAQCDFVMDHPKASRTHVRVECRGGAYWVVDHSANGTLVHIDGRTTLLRRDGLPLLGEGWISAGGREPLPDEQRVQFRVTQDADRNAGATRRGMRTGLSSGRRS